MDKAIETLVRITEREWNGRSLMGKPFLPCVRELPLEVARDTATYEGYSAWAVCLHVLYHKWAMLPVMGAEAPKELFPYEEADWPKPAGTQDAAWSRLLELLEKTHAAYVKALSALPPARLGEEIPAWKCSIGDALETMCLHDIYHVVQIRNMGLKKLP